MANSISPVRQQYLDVKRRYPNAIVFFRLGDFYETFDDDAQTVARELEIVLTSRNVAKGVRVPMAGIPHHAAESYLAKLIARGYHVAICEQVGETPASGLFAREVVRVVTPGTVLEPGLLPGDQNSFLAAALRRGPACGLAFVDLTTGEFHAAQVGEPHSDGFLRHELARIRPARSRAPGRGHAGGGMGRAPLALAGVEIRARPGRIRVVRAFSHEDPGGFRTERQTSGGRLRRRHPGLRQSQPARRARSSYGDLDLRRR